MGFMSRITGRYELLELSTIAMDKALQGQYNDEYINDRVKEIVDGSDMEDEDKVIVLDEMSRRLLNKKRDMI